MESLSNNINPRSCTNHRKPASFDITKDAIHRMLWDKYNRMMNCSNRRSTNASLFCPIVQVLQTYQTKVVVPTEVVSNDDKDSAKTKSSPSKQQKQDRCVVVATTGKRQNKLVVVISDTEFFITAIIEEGYVNRSNHRNDDNNNYNNTTLPCITDIQPNTLIHIHQYTTLFDTDNKFKIIIESFSILHPKPKIQQVQQQQLVQLGTTPPPTTTIATDINRSNRIIVLYQAALIQYRNQNYCYKGDFYIRDDDITTIVDPIVAILTAIDHSSNRTIEKVGYDGIIAIADAIRNNQNFEKLSLELNPMGSLGISILSNALLHNTTTLQLLELPNSNITDQGIQDIVDSYLQYTTTLQELNLDSNPIGNRGVQILFRLVIGRTNCPIQKIYISNIGTITKSGIRTISTVLQMNKSLHLLFIGGNNIGDDGVINIFTALRRNETLHHLYTPHNNISNIGLNFIAHELKYNSVLEELRLHGNVFDDDGALSLYKAMEYNTTVSKIVMDTRDPFTILARNGRDENNQSYVRFDPANIEGLVEYNTEMTNIIKSMIRLYNDTLIIICDPKFSPSLRQFIYHRNYPPGTTDYTIEGVRQQLQQQRGIASWKGQRQKMDILLWLFHNRNQWPPICKQQIQL